jgi:hypothetical protein
VISCSLAFVVGAPALGVFGFAAFALGIVGWVHAFVIALGVVEPAFDLTLARLRSGDFWSGSAGSSTTLLRCCRGPLSQSLCCRGPTCLSPGAAEAPVSVPRTPAALASTAWAVGASLSARGSAARENHFHQTATAVVALNPRATPAVPFEVLEARGPPQCPGCSSYHRSAPFGQGATAACPRFARPHPRRDGTRPAAPKAAGGISTTPYFLTTTTACLRLQRGAAFYSQPRSPRLELSATPREQPRPTAAW